MFEKEINYTKQDIVSILKHTDNESLSKLFAFACELKEANMGKSYDKFALIEFSNYCEKNCLYCRVRRSNESLQRFRLSPSAIFKKAKAAKEAGYKGIILESGGDSELNFDRKIEILSEIKNKLDISITLGIGEKCEEEYDKLRQAGAERFVLTHKTSDPILYRQLHPDMKYSNRIKCLNQLKTLGYKVGSGIMAGLPGQTFESIANDILLFRDMNIDIISIVPYIPYTNTPLEKVFEQSGGYFAPAVGYFDISELLYKIIAISRIVNPNANIQVLDSIEGYGFESLKAVRYGATEVLERI